MGTTWPTTSQSKSILNAARACFTEGRLWPLGEQLLDVGGDVRRSNRSEREPPALRPGEEARARPGGRLAACSGSGCSR